MKCPTSTALRPKTINTNDKSKCLSTSQKMKRSEEKGKKSERKSQNTLNKVKMEVSNA